jgi:hypothetical protein
MSSLKEEHAIPDYSELDEADRKVLDDWHGFFTYVCRGAFRSLTDFRWPENDTTLSER